MLRFHLCRLVLVVIGFELLFFFMLMLLLVPICSKQKRTMPFSHLGGNYMKLHMRAKMFRILLAIEICDSILWALNGLLITASKKKHDASNKILFSDLKSARKII